MSDRTALVTFLGSPGVSHLDHRGPVHSTFPRRFDAGNPVRIEGGGPFRCARCNKFFDVLPNDGVCPNVVTQQVRVGKEPNTKIVWESKECRSRDFEDDLEIEHYRQMAEDSPRTWRFEWVEEEEGEMCEECGEGPFVRMASHMRVHEEAEVTPSE